LSTSGSTKRWIALLAWIAVIFVFSTDTFSGTGTSRIIIPALHFLFPFLSPEQLAIGHVICRKAGHVLEYFVLGVLAWRAIRSSATGWRPELLTAGLILAVALSDEFHQSFVASRTSALTDVGFDFIGGIMGLFLMLRLRNGTRALYSHSIL
jgi:VanZ family protein